MSVNVSAETYALAGEVVWEVFFWMETISWYPLVADDKKTNRGRNGMETTYGIGKRPETYLKRKRKKNLTAVECKGSAFGLGQKPFQT